MQQRKPKIRRLRPYCPPAQKPLTLQCCAEPQDIESGKARRRYWDRRSNIAQEKNFDPNKCQRVATLIIDDKPLCRIHAGQLALKILLGEA